MADEERQLTIVEQIENSPIRRIWYQGEWWYSLVDVMAFIVGTKRARKYWYDLKKKIIDGGRVGGRARADLESQGLKVVSEQNYLDTGKQKRVARKKQQDQQPSLFDTPEE